MTAYENLILETKDGLGWITFNRPKALNALDTATVLELSRAVKEVERREDVHVLLLTGGGDKAFVAGADIAQMKGFTVNDAVEFSKGGHEATRRLERLQKPVIAVVNGFALGGGTEVALACDLIFASEKARFGQPEITLGIIPGFGGTQRLIDRIGVGRAKELIFAGEIIDAQRAHALGLVDRLFPHDTLRAEAEKFARKLAGFGAVALGHAKKAIEEGRSLGIDAGLDLEREEFSSLFVTEDAREGLTAFLEKRKPSFKHR